MKTKELKCTDLRIGNYLKYDDEIIQVSVLRKNYVEFYDKEDLLIGDNPKYFQPIELTEEVLVKIGFKKRCEKKIASFNVNEFIFNNDINDNEFVNISYILFESGNSIINMEHGDYYSGIDDNHIYKLNVKYLHQIQNAYYCLTGQELNIEL